MARATLPQYGIYLDTDSYGLMVEMETDTEKDSEEREGETEKSDFRHYTETKPIATHNQSELLKFSRLNYYNILRDIITPPPEVR